MPKKQHEDNIRVTRHIRMLSNTGYSRSYHKTDKVDSRYFGPENSEEKKGDNNNDGDSILPLALVIPDYVDDIEEWILKIVSEVGYSSLEEMMPYLSLPAKQAFVLENTDEVNVISPGSSFNIIRNAVILSKCNAVGYDLDSPMIFTRKRLNRSVNLITINLKSFYELD